MKKYIGKRIISFLIVLVGVSILSFLLIAWSGKDPAEIIAHRGVSNPTPEQIEMIRVEMGLDQPLPVRYIQWLSGMFTGELGTSLTTHQPIVKDLHKYLATTTSLVGMAILWIIVLTVPISLLCARKRNRLFDQVTRGITICGICVPTFWLGFLLLLFFAIHLKWFSVLPSQVGGAFYYLHLPWRFPVRVHSSELCVPLFWLNYLLIMFGLQKPVDYLPTEFWYATFCEMPYRLLLQFSFSNSAF